MKIRMALLGLVVSCSAMAGQSHAPTPKPTPTPTPVPTTVTVTDNAAAQAAARAAAQASAAAQAAAKSNSDSTANNAATNAATNTADNGGNSLSTTTNTKALALGLAPLVAAPAIALACMETTAGKGAFGAGVTGRNKLNAQCLAFTQCMSMVDKYQQLGQIALAVQKLDTCDGSQTEGRTVVLQQDLSIYATKEQVNRMYQQSQSK